MPPFKTPTLSRHKLDFGSREGLHLYSPFAKIFASTLITQADRDAVFKFVIECKGGNELGARIPPRFVVWLFSWDTLAGRLELDESTFGDSIYAKHTHLKTNIEYTTRLLFHHLEPSTNNESADPEASLLPWVSNQDYDTVVLRGEDYEHVWEWLSESNRSMARVSEQWSRFDGWFIGWA